MTDTDKSHKIAQLNPRNYARWYFSLEVYAAIIKAIPHLEGDPPVPAEEQAVEQYYEKKNKLLAAILSSVPDDIMDLILVPKDRLTPHALVQKIIAHINQSTQDDHEFLKTEAESITIGTADSIDDYLQKHLDVRRQMIAAKYPRIEDEKTTVDFIISGLRRNPSYSTVLGNILGNKPKTIKDFTRRYKDISTLYVPTPGAASSSNSPTTAFTGDYGPRARSYNRPYPRPYSRGRGTYRAIPPHQLCKFHTSLGIPCQHTDKECRDPRHPKNHVGATVANMAHIPISYAPYHYHYPPPTPLHATAPNPPHPQALPPPPPPPQAETLSEAGTEATGTFTLDSGAHPSHIPHSTPSMTPITSKTLTHTATNAKTQCTHRGIIRILPRKSKQHIITHAVANPAIKHHLLSVHDLASRYGLVLFTPNHGYILNTRINPPALITKARWRNNQYQFRGSLNTGTTAHTARTLPRKSRHGSRKPKVPHTTSKPKSCSPPRLAARSRTTPPPIPVSKPRQIRHTLRSLPKLPNLTQKRISNISTHMQDWHLRLNHASPHKLSLTARNRLIPRMPATLPADTKLTCKACQHAQLQPAPHKRTQHNYPPGAYVSSDTCGPVKPTSIHGNNHILIVICAATRFAITHFIRDRKDIPAHIDQTLRHIRSRMHHPLHTFRSDNAKEYTSARMQKIYDTHGVQHKLRTPHQPQENSIAERFNKTIMTAVRATLHTAQLDDRYWEDAARDAVFKYNLLHHSAIGTSPYELWHGKKPELSRIYTFGQLGTIPVFAPKSKLESRADPARYMYATSLSHIVILNLRTNAYQEIRTTDFRPYHKHSDPSSTTATAFSARASMQQHIPEQIQLHTPPPAHLQQARLYPDAPKWQTAHDKELHNIDAHGCIEWQPPEFKPPTESVIPLMMLYRYKRDSKAP